jgi:hypothetical protein
MKIIGDMKIIEGANGTKAIAKAVEDAKAKVAAAPAAVEAAAPAQATQVAVEKVEDESTLSQRCIIVLGFQ